MNIFVLDSDVRTCAQYHCDQHVVKMILESAQLLCTALSKLGYMTPYKPTHMNHPCTLWLEESYDNFLWLEELASELNQEYRYRYQRNKDHASMNVIREISSFKYASRGLTEFAQAMPDTYKVPGDPVKAYRAFYNGEKLRFATWTRRKPPYWIKPHHQPS